MKAARWMSQCTKGNDGREGGADADVDVVLRRVVVEVVGGGWVLNASRARAYEKTARQKRT